MIQKFPNLTSKRFRINFAALVILSTCSLALSQNVNLYCEFWVGNGYGCNFDQVTVIDDPHQSFTIGGQHNPGRTNADVRQIHHQDSQIPFVISELFATFPNTIDVFFRRSGLTRFQSDAFRYAGNLEFVSASGNPLREIQANAFNGAAKLMYIDMWNNEVETVHENAFNGLESLIELRVTGSRILTLPVNVFSPLPNLQIAQFDVNLIESLDGRIFENNPTLRTIGFSGNRITAIGREFLNGLSELRTLNFNSNLCVDRMWIIGGVTSIENVIEDLQPCFNSAV